LNIYASSKLHKVSAVPWTLLPISPIVGDISQIFAPGIVRESQEDE
jgi:hypothetical protein